MAFLSWRLFLPPAASWWFALARFSSSPPALPTVPAIALLRLCCLLSRLTCSIGVCLRLDVNSRTSDRELGGCLPLRPSAVFCSVPIHLFLAVAPPPFTLFASIRFPRQRCPSVCGFGASGVWGRVYTSHSLPLLVHCNDGSAAQFLVAAFRLSAFTTLTIVSGLSYLATATLVSFLRRSVLSVRARVSLIVRPLVAFGPLPSVLPVYLRALTPAQLVCAALGSIYPRLEACQCLHE